MSFNYELWKDRQMIKQEREQEQENAFRKRIDKLLFG